MSAASAIVEWCGEGKVLVASSRADVRDRILREFPSAGQALEAKGGADALIQLAAANFRMLLIDPHLEDLNVRGAYRNHSLTVPARPHCDDGGRKRRRESPDSTSPCDRENPSRRDHPGREGSSLAWNVQPEQLAMEPRHPPLCHGAVTLNDWYEQKNATTVSSRSSRNKARHHGTDCGRNGNRKRAGGARNP